MAGELNGGVMLGGRELRITIPQAHAHDLKQLAGLFGTTPHALATNMLMGAIEQSATQVAVGLAVTGVGRWVR